MLLKTDWVLAALRSGKPAARRGSTFVTTMAILTQDPVVEAECAELFRSGAVQYDDVLAESVLDEVGGMDYGQCMLEIGAHWMSESAFSAVMETAMELARDDPDLLAPIGGVLRRYFAEKPDRAQGYAGLVRFFFRSESIRVRLEGIRLVGHLADIQDGEVAEIVDALTDESSHIREAAAVAIRTLAGRRRLTASARRQVQAPGTRSRLRKLKNDQHSGVRSAAQAALHALGKE